MQFCSKLANHLTMCVCVCVQVDMSPLFLERQPPMPNRDAVSLCVCVCAYFEGLLIRFCY